MDRSIYVVDDFPAIVELCHFVLEDAGYTVRGFNDRALALQAFLTADPQPGLLITDYDGYPITAEELMRACRRIQPGLKILMSSGYLESRMHFTHIRPDRYLPKPYRIEELMATVEALVGPPAPMGGYFLQDL
ncbi:MAG TPA: response regulator [Candidatus Paceibacterota bacterium]|nr:response regulator [Verrucomicrobiota bacterium]HSA08902.1 response regulator [Candidatus Paceibacterota bacterium]